MTDTQKNDQTTPETPETETQTQAPEATPAPEAQNADAQMLEMKERMLRALADAENTRKRAERMQAETSKYAISGFARDLLDVADNLRRAIDAVPADARTGNETLDTLLQGIEATERNLLNVFEKNGVRKLAPEGGTFDPHQHEVMFEAEVPGKQAGEIIQLLEPGYMIADRLLRPARVGVAKASGAPAADHTVDESV